jgi:hypothetical protein
MIDQLMQVRLPDGKLYSRESTPDINLDKEAQKYLRRRKLDLQDVTTYLTAKSSKTGKTIQFTYMFSGDAWKMEVSVRCFNNDIPPFNVLFGGISYEKTLDITGTYTKDFLC